MIRAIGPAGLNTAGVLNTAALAFVPGRLELRQIPRFGILKQPHAQAEQHKDGSQHDLQSGLHAKTSAFPVRPASILLTRTPIAENATAHSPPVSISHPDP